MARVQARAYIYLHVRARNTTTLRIQRLTLTRASTSGKEIFVFSPVRLAASINCSTSIDDHAGRRSTRLLLLRGFCCQAMFSCLEIPCIVCSLVYGLGVVQRVSNLMTQAWSQRKIRLHDHIFVFHAWCLLRLSRLVKSHLLNVQYTIMVVS